MNLQDVILKRKSIRSFRKNNVPNLDNIIALAKLCPSAGGVRGYKYIITKEKIISRIDAPVYIIICSDREAYVKRYGDRGKNLYSIQDATIFGAYFQLLLVDIGLSSVWIGAFDESKIKKAIGTELKPIAIIALGYG